MIKNIPNKIYLNTGYERTDTDFYDLFEVTWSKDKTYVNDIEYFSKDYLLSVLSLRREKVIVERGLCEEGTMRGGQQKHRLAGIKKEIDYLIKLLNEK